MSRVGKKPIPVPGKTKITYKDRVITVQGEKGTLTRTINPHMDLEIDKDVIKVSMQQETKSNRALQGLTRSLVANMVIGVNKGFEKVLEINGIGYRASLSGNTIVLNLGFSHPINFELPDGIAAKVDKKNTVTLSGINKELLGQTAASIRSLRPPEPYKGKGIKYADEYVQRKAGKTGTK